MTQTNSLPELDIDTLPLADLQSMRDGADRVVEAHRTLKKGGLNVVGECLKNQGTFYEMQHYPKGDVYDNESYCQYYYHNHREDMDEHGHFHTFMRAGGMKGGMKPVPYKGEVSWPNGNDALSHIISISMDSAGFPIGLFATNRWVTGEAWYKSEHVIKMLDSWEIDHAFPNLSVNQWISGMVKLFKPQIVALLEQRDTVVAEWKEKHPDEDVFEDRRLEVTGEYQISVKEQHAAILKAIKKH